MGRVSIDELITIKVFSDDMANFRVHSVLYFKYIDWVIALHHSFKQTLIVIEVKRDSGENSGGELIWISNQDESFAIVHQRNQVLNLY
jgi:hypothetical protein